MTTLWIRAARVIDPLTGRDKVSTLAIRDGALWLDRLPERSSDAEVVDGRSGALWVLPAFIDMHTHLRDPGQTERETLETGLAAAAAGGFGAVCAMPNTDPPTDTPERVAALRARGEELGGVHLHPVAGITRGLQGTELVDMEGCRRAGAVAFSDNGACLMDAALMRAALRRSRELRCPIIQHAEDEALVHGGVINEGELADELDLPGRPPIAEAVIVARDVLLAEDTAGYYHVAHLTTARAATLVRAAQERGVAVTAEATPHHLWLSEEYVRCHGSHGRVNPPLRGTADVAAVRAAVRDGTVTAIATDHAPHTAQAKSLPITEAPPGLIGLEFAVPTLLALVRRGELPLHRVLYALTVGPANILNLPAPALRVGRPATLCVIDPEMRYTLTPSTLHSRSANHPLVGATLQGAVLLTLVDGRVCYRRQPGERA